jgi:hypothetical protein
VCAEASTVLRAVAAISSITIDVWRSLRITVTGNRSSYRNVVFLSYLEFWTIGEVQKPSGS